MSNTTATASTAYGKTPVQKGALVFGIVFAIVGLAGFVPGLTQGNIGAAGNGSMAMLLGLFQVSVLHNVVHLLFGIVGLLAARSAHGSRLYLIVGGIIYAVLWIYGLFTANQANAANFVPLNTADNWLHLILAIGMVVLGIILSRARGRVTDSRAATR